MNVTALAYMLTWSSLVYYLVLIETSVALAVFMVRVALGTWIHAHMG